jgi:hypothetical protein
MPYLEGDEFTAVMNYNFAFTHLSIFFDERKTGFLLRNLIQSLRDLREAYDSEVAYGMQNLIDSHDTARMEN